MYTYIFIYIYIFFFLYIMTKWLPGDFFAANVDGHVEGAEAECEH